MLERVPRDPHCDVLDRTPRCANGCWRSSPSPASRASRAGPPPAISGSSGATTPGCARHPAERAPVRLVEPRLLRYRPARRGLRCGGQHALRLSERAVRPQRTWPGGRRRVSATTSTSTPKAGPRRPHALLPRRPVETHGETQRTHSGQGGEPVLMDVYRSVHGLIVKFDESQHVAYAKARAWEGYEMQSLLAWCARRSRPTGTSGRPRRRVTR